jgi:DNA (cytosine-5)-methyltransferase 1
MFTFIWVERGQVFLFSEDQMVEGAGTKAECLTPGRMRSCVSYRIAGMRASRSEKSTLSRVLGSSLLPRYHSFVTSTSRQLRLVEPPRKRSRSHGRLTRAPFNVVGLFAGIGGVELGLGRSKHVTTLLCEIEAGARAVLDARFRRVAKWDDVCTLKSLPEGTDLLTAGFPCQDLSQAGRTLGIDGSRSGLVGEVFRLLRKQRIPNVLIENVPFMLQLGKGRALDTIVSALEDLGYRWAYRVVNSRAFGVPQRRERVYLLAMLDDDPRDVLMVDDEPEPIDLRPFREVACGFYWTEGLRGLGWAVDSVPTLKGGSTIGIPSPPAIIFPDGSVGKPDLRDAERMQGFPEDWTKPAETVAKRGARWKLVGNAVTVDAAAWIGRRLRRPGVYDPSGDLPLRPGDRWPNAAYNLGDGRCSAQLSTFPVITVTQPLEQFLEHAVEPLSEKATAGFLERAGRASLRFPEGFIAALEVHLARMSGTPRRAII